MRRTAFSRRFVLAEHHLPCGVLNHSGHNDVDRLCHLAPGNNGGPDARLPTLLNCAREEDVYTSLREGDPWHLALASRVLGYRRAESNAVRYRRARRTLSTVWGALRQA